MSPRLSMKDIEARASHKPAPSPPHCSSALPTMQKSRKHISVNVVQNVISMSIKKQEFDNQNTCDIEKDTDENFTNKTKETIQSPKKNCFHCRHHCDDDR